MACVCSGSLILIDAGVALSESLTGVAMGLVIQEKEIPLLTTA